MKNKFTRFLCLAAALTLSTACAATGPEVTPGSLAQRTYVLDSVDGKNYTLQSPAPTIAFNENLRVSGAICNQFAGQGVLVDGVLTVNQMASTRKLCFEQELNQYEHLISQMLMNGVELKSVGPTLVMRQGGHELVYRLENEDRVK